MDWLISLATFLVNEILSQPAYLIGLITAAGLIALKKTAGQVVGGALKATLGFLLIGAAWAGGPAHGGGPDPHEDRATGGGADTAASSGGELSPHVPGCFAAGPVGRW